MNPRAIVVGAAILAVGLLAYQPRAVDTPVAVPVAPEPVAPCPAPEPAPPLRPKPGPWDVSAVAAVGGPIHADGTEIMLDLPPSMHQRNSGGNDNPDGRNPHHEPGKGSGLCVFASMRHSGLWCDEPVFSGLFDYMKHHPGGSYPAKTDQMIAAYCKEKGTPKPEYIQVESADIDILKQACAAGLMPAVTTMRHSHMISLFSADDKWFVTVDNNLPGKYNWQTPSEFKSSYMGGQSKGWAVIPLKPGPPPVPHNAQTQETRRMRYAIPVVASAALALSLGIHPPAPEIAQALPAGHVWQPWPGGEEYALIVDGKQVGSWNTVRGTYRPILPSGEWGPKGEPPVELPVPMHGVDGSKMCSHEGGCYRLNGVRVDKQTVTAAITAAGIPDRKGMLRMVVIGSKDKTAPVVSDFTATSHPWAKHLIVQAYAPDHWHVQPGYSKDGSPSITVMDEGGAVVWRQDDYAGGATALSAALDATPAGKLRKPDPKYDPAKDPNPKNKPIPGVPAGSAPLLALGAVVAGAVYLRSRTPAPR